MTEQASSTETQTSESVGASNLSSEETGKAFASDASTSGEAESLQTNQADVSTGGATQPAGNDVNNLDEKGVGKNTDFCGNAAKPFNASGKKKGQWKKRQGVAEADYDKWYEESLAMVSAGPSTELQADAGDNVTQIDTSNAFANQQQQNLHNDSQQQAPAGAGNLTFKDGGEFMQWLSEQQAAELITPGDIDVAYQTTSVGMGDLFDPAKATQAVIDVYGFLSALIAKQA